MNEETEFAQWKRKMDEQESEYHSRKWVVIVADARTNGNLQRFAHWPAAVYSLLGARLLGWKARMFRDEPKGLINFQEELNKLKNDW
jgi:hypothetical protein